MPVACVSATKRPMKTQEAKKAEPSVTAEAAVSLSGRGHRFTPWGADPQGKGGGCSRTVVLTASTMAGVLSRALQLRAKRQGSR